MESLNSHTTLPRLMVFLAYLPFFAFAAPSTAIVLNATELGPFMKPVPNSLNLAPLPNPFPVPNSGITLDFVVVPGPSAALPVNDFFQCFARAKDNFDDLIRNRGDGPIARISGLTYGEVKLTLRGGDIPILRMTYTEALYVLVGISIKMAREGYVNRHARVLQTDGGDFLGLASVKRVGT